MKTLVLSNEQSQREKKAEVILLDVKTGRRKSVSFDTALFFLVTNRFEIIGGTYGGYNIPSGLRRKELRNIEEMYSCTSAINSLMATSWLD
jgi:hypothetical protein